MWVPRSVVLLIFISCVQSYNILGIFPYEGKSHFFVFKVLLKELAERGHNITVISQFPLKDAPTNYHDVTITTEEDLIAMPVVPRTYAYHFNLAKFLGKLGTDDCELMLSNEKVQDIVKSKQKFDVVLIEQFNSDCGLGLAYKLNAPVVAITSHVMFPWHYKRLGLNDHQAYTLTHLLEGGTKPSLYQRVERLIVNAYYTIYYNFVTLPTTQNIVQKYLGDVPTLDELASEVKLTLLYHHFSLTGPQVLPTNVVEVGGFHVAKPEPLPGDLKKFIDEAEQGVIYISFGSVAQSFTLAEDKQRAIVDAMAEFPQRFIWKWDKNNFQVDKKKLLIANWLPQKDILAHPNTLAFLSHGGMLGTNEAITFGVPIVCMPIFGDQPANGAAIEESGFGVQIQIQDMTKDNIVAAFKTVLDKGFNNKVKILSKAWSDRPQSALDTAIFWTEYVAKYPQLKYRPPAADVPLYQFLHLDVIAVLLAIIVLPLTVIVISIKRVCRKNDTKSVTKAKKQNKRPKRE